MSLGALCTILFFAGAGLYLFKVSRKFAPFAFLLSGVGVSGAVGAMGDTAADFVVDGGGALTRVVAGTTVVLAIAVFIGLYLYSRMVKSSGGGLLTCIVAFLFPTILSLVGLGELVSLLETGLSTVGGLLPSLGV